MTVLPRPSRALIPALIPALLLTGLLAGCASPNKPAAPPAAEAPAAAPAATKAPPAKPGEVVGYMTRIMQEASGTPQGMGLLPTAEGEAQAALKYSAAITTQPEKLEWMQDHAAYLLHTLDPATGKPGDSELGYGLIPAIKGIITNAGLIAGSTDATDVIRGQARQVVASAETALERAVKLKLLAEAILNAKDAKSAAAYAHTVTTDTPRIIDGFDANGDGRLASDGSEGGLTAIGGVMVSMGEAKGLSF